LRISLSEVKSKKEIDDYIFYLRDNFSPKSISILTSKKLSKSNEGLKITNDDLLEDEFHETLLREHLEALSNEKEVIEKAIEMSKEFSISSKDKTPINWILKDVEWENMFSYKGSHKIDFEGLSGVTGFFGKNYSGKS